MNKQALLTKMQGLGACREARREHYDGWLAGDLPANLPGQYREACAGLAACQEERKLLADALNKENAHRTEVAGLLVSVQADLAACRQERDHWLAEATRLEGECSKLEIACREAMRKADDHHRQRDELQARIGREIEAGVNEALRNYSR